MVRRSPWREYGFWINNGHKKVPSRIDLYDVESREMVERYVMTERQSLVLFQLDALPEHLWV